MNQSAGVDDGVLIANLPAISWTTLRLIPA
jgi:hypothetical protein